MNDGRPTVTDVADPVRLERAMRLLFDERNSNRETIRQLSGRVEQLSAQIAAGTGTPVPSTTDPGSNAPIPHIPGGGGFIQSPYGKSVGSVQSSSGVAGNPQPAAIPRLDSGMYSFDDDLTARGYALASYPQTMVNGYDGELRVDEDEPVTLVGSQSTWPDYNAMSWRFDGRDRIWKPLQALGCLVIGNPATLLASHYARGTILFYPTQRVYYYCDYDPTVSPTDGHMWIYLGGVFRDVLANKPTWGTGEIGALFYATDYDHLFRWSGGVGPTWGWGPGEIGSGFMQLFTQAPNTSGANSWGLFNGSTYTVCKKDATTQNIVTINMTGHSYVSDGNTYNGTFIVGTGNYGGIGGPSPSRTGTDGIGPSFGLFGNGATPGVLGNPFHEHGFSAPVPYYTEFFPYLRR